MKISLCLEAAEGPQWPRLCSLGRPRSWGCMPSIHGQVLGVLGWALTRICNSLLVLDCYTQEMSTVVVCGKEP